MNNSRKIYLFLLAGRAVVYSAVYVSKVKNVLLVNQ